MCLFYGLYYIKILESELKKKDNKSSMEDLFKQSLGGSKKNLSIFGGDNNNPFAKRINPFGKGR